MFEFAPNYEIPNDVVSEILKIVEGINNISDIPFGLLDPIKQELLEVDQIFKMKSQIEEIGIASFDFSIPEHISFKNDMIASAATFHLVSSLFFSLNPSNRAPFDTYKCTTENRSELMDAGIKFYTPEEKLGFHNDAFIRKGKYYIPKYVSLINLFIGYDKPGNFYYINHDFWDEFDDFFTLGKNKKFKFKPTPMVYESMLEGDIQDSQWGAVPAFWENSNHQRFAFYNGELEDSDGDNFIERFQNSLRSNSKRIQVPQKLHRIMIFKNDTGFHSRDIFEEQKVLNGTTRLFLRSVSKESDLIPNTIKINSFSLA